MPRILVKKRAEVIAEYKIGGRGLINIGSIKDNEIQLREKSVSENHCTLTKIDEHYEIKDNNTLTGTMLNGHPVMVSELAFGDEVGIGPFTLIFLEDITKKEKDTEMVDDEESIGSSSRDHKTAVKCFLGIYGKFEGKKFILCPKDTYIGRQKISPKGIENDIVLSGDMTVSKGHARIELRGEDYFIKDVGSTGGVALNGKKIGQLNESLIKAGDEIAIGRTIFRLVESGLDDYSEPKRHNVFFLKAKAPLIRTIALLVCLLAVFVGISGTRGLIVSESKAKRILLDIDSNWVPVGNAVRSEPGNFDITSSAAVGDLNRDGINDVVFFSPTGLLYAWDGRTGRYLWDPVEIFNSGKSSPVLCDMNSDGILDITVISDTSMLHIIDGLSGRTIHKEVLGGAVSDLSPAVGDINKDGKPDVVACSEDGMVHFVYSPGFSDVEKFTEFIEGPIYASPVILETERISPMVVICSYGSKVFFIDGKNRTKKTLDLNEKTGKIHLLTAAPAIGDLNGDGTPEVITMSSVPQYVSAIDITSFNINWTYFVEPVPPADLSRNASPVAVDLTGDGLLDVAFVSANGCIYGLKGRTGYPAGELILRTKLQGAGRLIGALALYDFDRDGLADICFGTESGEIIVMKSQPRIKEFETLANIKVSNDPITSSMIIGDIDSTGRISILYGNMCNFLQKVKTNVKTLKGKVFWPMYLGSSMRSGALEYKENKLPHILSIISGVVSLLVVFIIYLIRRQRRMSKRPKIVYI